MIRAESLGHLNIDAKQLVFFDFNPKDYKPWLEMLFKTKTDNHYVLYNLVMINAIIPPWITLLLNEEDFRLTNQYLAMNQKVKGLALSGRYNIDSMPPDILHQFDWIIVAVGAMTESIIKKADNNGIAIYCPDFGRIEYPNFFENLSNLNEVILIETAERTIKGIPAAIQRSFISPFRGTEWTIRLFDFDLKKVIVLPLSEVTSIKPFDGWIFPNKVKLILPN